MIEYIYRFRPIKSLFDFEELEKQQIFFAEPKALNDPLEDYKDIFWKGDETLWKNLLKNYLLCLQNVYLLLRIGGDDYPIDDESIPVFTTYDKLPTPMYKEKIKSLFEEFFNQEQIKTLLKGISTRDEVRRDELLFYLESIHPLCLHLVQKHDDTVSDDKKETSKEFENNTLTEEFFSALKQSRIENPDINDLEDTLFEIANHSRAQTKLIIELNEKEKLKPNKKFYLFDFPVKYVSQIEQLMFWPWYTACFTNNPNNSSMWGYYTNSHTGVCLKFKTASKNNTEGLNLRTITSYGGSKDQLRKGYGNRFFELHQINYNKKLEPVDFFRTIGRLPYPDLLNQWYSNENKEVSPLVKDIAEGQESWRTKYWDKFLINIPVKTREWSHEEEYRLIHYSVLDHDISSEDRTLEYDFNDLEGIIFGINTSDEDKIKIIKIIHDKCEKVKRTDFNFYQASYDNRTGKISHQKLGLIKFSF